MRAAGVRTAVTVAGLALASEWCWSAAYYVSSENGKEGSPGTRTQPLQTIAEGLLAAEPGDSIVLLPGTYYGTTTITQSGAPERPITIVGERAEPGHRAVIDGKGVKGDKHARNYGFLIDDASWIVLRDLEFQNCWNTAIHLDDASYVSIRGCEILCAGRAVHATGAGTHHILLEHCHWKPEGRAMWKEWSWPDMKREGRPYYYLAQGSMYAGGSAAGAVVIRHNEVEYTFNGVQIFADSPNNNANIEIYGNTFEHIRDNVIEPEHHIFNLHVYHNVINNCSQFAVSVDSCRGGPMYFYGNVGLIDESDPPQPGYCAGKIFKFVTSQKRFLDEPLYIYHNSWYKYAKPFRGNRFQKHIRHYNNAYHVTQGYEMTEWVDKMQQWDNYSDHNCLNRPWPDAITRNGQEEHGLENTSPAFLDPGRGDFHLKPESPCIDAGRILRGFTQSYQGKAPDMGAYEGNRLVEGPPFQTLVPPGGLMYEERPRISRHRIRGRELHLFFSWPIKPETLREEAVRLTADGYRAVVSGVEMGRTDREAVVKIGRSLEGKKLTLLLDPPPIGQNGVPATHWASTVDVPQ